MVQRLLRPAHPSCCASTPDQSRLSSRQWTGDIVAENTFAAGVPLLAPSVASLADLSTRLAARGQALVTMQRFRPDLVFDGLKAFDQDHIDQITVVTVNGTVHIKLVKPCTRCGMPNVEPASAGHEPAPDDAARTAATSRP